MAWNFKNIFARRVSPSTLPDTPKRGFSFNSGTPVTPETSMQVSAFYRGVIYISSQIAKLPFYVKDKNNEILYDAKATYLLNLQPNPEMTSFFFRLYLIQSSLITGNGYAEIQRDALGNAIAFWPIPSEAVQVMRTRDGDLVYKVLNGTSTGEPVYIPKEDMIHIKNFHTRDGIMGQGVVAYAITTLGINIGADQFASGLFSNGALPSGILEVPGTLDDDAFKRIKEDWQANYGKKKTGSVAVLEEGMKFTPVSITPDVLQFLESRKFSVVEIARFLGVPPTKLFDMDGAKYGNMENANLEVATDCLDTWARMIEQEIDIKVLKGQFGGRKSELDLYSLFRGDSTTRSNYFSKMMQVGAMSPNEIRTKEGMAPYSGGDRMYIAINNFTPSDRLDEVIDSQVAKGKQDSTQPKTNIDNAKNQTEALAAAAADFLKSKR